MSEHGIFIQEEATPLTVPITGSAGVPVVIGAAPINVLDDPAAVVNTPILANSAAEAMEALGYNTDFQKFGLCQEMYVTGNIYQVAPVVYINVLDPATHKKALASTTVPVSEMQATVKQTGILKAGLSVSLALTQEAGASEGSASGDGADLDNPGSGSTSGSSQTSTASNSSLVEGTDYTLGFDANGYLVITLIAGGAGADASALIVSGFQIDPEAVTKNDIIGAVNPSTGKETGAEVIRQVYPKLGVVPGLIIAPGWSQVPEVGIALAAKAASINGCFKAMAIIDLPSDATGAKKYTDVKSVKENCGFNSQFSAVVWPCFKVGSFVLAASAVMAALTAYTDAENDDVPSVSPSNEMLGVTGTCLADGTDVYLDQNQAGTVNKAGVTTAINMNGWRLWGNYTAAYPSATDPKDIWFPVRRMFNWHGNNFILTYFNKVDDPMNNILIESVVDAENIRCAAYAPEKWAGAVIEYRKEDNPDQDILSGKIKFRQRIAPYTPAQEIDNILSYDVDMLSNSLTG